MTEILILMGCFVFFCVHVFDEVKETLLEMSAGIYFQAYRIHYPRLILYIQNTTTHMVRGYHHRESEIWVWI